MELKFAYSRSTKGTHVYQELDEEGDPNTSEYIIGQLYIRKEYFEGKKTKGEAAVIVVDLSIEGEE